MTAIQLFKIAVGRNSLERRIIVLFVVWPVVNQKLIQRQLHLFRRAKCPTITSNLKVNCVTCNDRRHSDLNTSQARVQSCAFLDLNVFARQSPTTPMWETTCVSIYTRKYSI